MFNGQHLAFIATSGVLDTLDPTCPGRTFRAQEQIAHITTEARPARDVRARVAFFRNKILTGVMIEGSYRGRSRGGVRGESR
jgi:hypothetical protein